MRKGAGMLAGDEGTPASSELSWPLLREAAGSEVAPSL